MIPTRLQTGRLPERIDAHNTVHNVRLLLAIHGGLPDQVSSIVARLFAASQRSFHFVGRSPEFRRVNGVVERCRMSEVDVVGMGRMGRMGRMGLGGVVAVRTGYVGGGARRGGLVLGVGDGRQFRRALRIRVWKY